MGPHAKYLLLFRRPVPHLSNFLVLPTISQVKQKNLQSQSRPQLFGVFEMLKRISLRSLFSFFLLFICMQNSLFYLTKLISTFFPPRSPILQCGA